MDWINFKSNELFIYLNYLSLFSPILCTEYQNRYYIAVPLLYLADPDIYENDDQFVTGELKIIL